MNDSSDLKHIIRPLLKGWHFIAIFVAVAALIASQYVYYATPLYQTVGSMRIDDAQSGAPSASLYKDFNVFSVNNKIETELEVIKSKYMIKRALSRLDFDVTYYRKGKIRTTELYHDSPFLIEYVIRDSTIFDPGRSLGTCNLTYVGKDGFWLSFSFRGSTYKKKTQFNEVINYPFISLRIVRNEALLKNKPTALSPGNYTFKISSLDALTEQYLNQHFLAKAVEKDVSVIKIYYKHEVPQKAAAFVNAVIDAYIHNSVEAKTEAASTTVRFIDQQLEKVTDSLKASEVNLEQFRKQNRVINLTQETDTELKKATDLEMKKMEIELQEAQLSNLYQAITANQDLRSMSTNFGALRDELFSNSILTLQRYQQEREDLFLKYSAEHPKVITLEDKIRDTQHYLAESIQKTRKDLKNRRFELEQALGKEEAYFSYLPTKEKELLAFRRDFIINEKVYNFLVEKRMEASIAEAATISFHKVLERAIVPTHPVSPNKMVVFGLSIFLAIALGLVFVYARHYTISTIGTREELERYTQIPVAGIIRKKSSGSFLSRLGQPETASDDFISLLTHLHMQSGQAARLNMIAVTSTISEEGKTFVVVNLAKALAKTGKKVVVVDLNFYNPQLHAAFDMPGVPGFADVFAHAGSHEDLVRQTQVKNIDLVSAGTEIDNAGLLSLQVAEATVLEDLKNRYDVVLLDLPAVGMVIDPMPFIRTADMCLYVARANFTKTSLLTNADWLSDEYGVDNLTMLLNGVTEASNYSGYYTGNRYEYGRSNLFRQLLNRFRPKRKKRTTK